MSATAVFTAPSWMSPRLVRPHACVVTSRRVAPGASRLHEVVARADELFGEPIELGDAGRLVVRRAFTRVEAAPVAAWATTGVVYVRGLHLAKTIRVEVELAEYSTEACVLGVRPVSQNVRRWGKWRYERYFDLAHRVADTLMKRLAVTN